MKHTSLLLGLLLAQAWPLFAAEPRPTDAAAPAPPASYRSAFEDYRQANEEPVADWRALNDDVAAVGGHVGIMRGPAQPVQAVTPPSMPNVPASAEHHH